MNEIDASPPLEPIQLSTVKRKRRTARKRPKGKQGRALPKGNMMMIFVSEDFTKSSEGQIFF